MPRTVTITINYARVLARQLEDTQAAARYTVGDYDSGAGTYTDRARFLQGNGTVVVAVASTDARADIRANIIAAIEAAEGLDHTIGDLFIRPDNSSF